MDLTLLAQNAIFFVKKQLKFSAIFALTIFIVHSIINYAKAVTYIPENNVLCVSLNYT